MFEISIYHYPDGDQAREDDWALMLRSLRKERVLRVLSRFREVPVDSVEMAALEEVFEQISTPVRRTRR